MVRISQLEEANHRITMIFARIFQRMGDTDDKLEGQIHAINDALGLLMSRATSTAPDTCFNMIDAFRGSVDASRQQFDDERAFDAATRMSENIVEEAQYWLDFERGCAANLI